MKNLHVIFNKGKYWFDFKLTRFDIKKAIKMGKLDVIFGIGMGWTRRIDVNTFNKDSGFFLVLDWPKFGVKETEYKSPVYLKWKTHKER